MKTTPDPTGSHTIVWWVPIPEDISDSLVSWENPDRQVTNNDIEISGSVLHHSFISH